MSVPVVFAIAGVIALFLSVWGGGIKAKEIEIPQSSPKARLIVGAVGTVLIGFSILLDKFPTPTNQSDALSTTPNYITLTALVPTLTPTQTAFTETPAPSPTVTSVPTLTVEEEAKELLAQTTQSWKLIVLDTFDTNDHLWPVGEQPNSDNKGIAYVSVNGKYHVDIQKSACSGGFWLLSTIQTPEKFFLSTDARLISKQGCAMALIWGTSKGNYRFNVFADEKNYNLLFYDQEADDGWTEVIRKTTTNVIHSQDMNRLSVINDGAYIWLYINDQYLTRTKNEYASADSLGYYAIVCPEITPVTFEFDNLELRSP